MKVKWTSTVKNAEISGANIQKNKSTFGQERGKMTGVCDKASFSETTSEQKL